jgi:MscS family membrane protein
VRDWMPERLQRSGPGGLLFWQWLALPALLVLALVLGRILGAFTTALLHRLFRKTPTEWDERLLERTSPALSLLWAVVVAAALLPWLALLPEAHRSVRSLLGGLATLAVFWAIWRSVDVWAQFLMERPWAKDNPSARSLLSVTRNLTKAFVAIGGVVATVAAFGYPVATVLAGLGIGGIALAFGAQKTIENLFGSVALAADEPFRVGDFVKIEDFTGNVEHIGMRSTQIRTLDRTLVSLPNGKLADMRIEDFASRDRIRFAATVSLVYGTTEEQVRRVVSGIEAMLRGTPRVWPDTVVAKLAALSPSSLDVEVLCWFQTGDFGEFRDLRQEALFGIMRIVEGSGTSFAYPTQAVHVVRPKAGKPPA